MNDFVQKYLTTVLAALTISATLAMLKLFMSVAALQAKHGREWELEKTLILVEVGKVDARVSANEANIEELENEVRNIR